MSLSTQLVAPEKSQAKPPNRLNHFQRMMLKWDRIHPYNATHTVSLAGTLDAHALKQAIHDTYQEVGIGMLILDPKRRNIRYEPVDRIELREISPTDNLEESLRAVISEEMNAPFPDGPHDPVRWVVVTDSANDAHHIVLAYHHVAGDAYSIQALLALILRRYLGLPPHAESLDSHTPPPPHGTQFRRRSSWLVAGISFGRSIRQYFKLRSAHRMHNDRSGCSQTDFLSRSAPKGMLKRLRAACKSGSVGLNDALLAAIAAAIAEMTPARRTHRRRRKVAVATVVSHRGAATKNPSSFLDVCIDDAVVFVDRPDTGFRDVLAQIAPQTRRLRSSRGTTEPSWRFLFVKYLWPSLRIPHREASYRKVFPLCAGVSTVPIDAGLFGETMEYVRRYVRACPPGPAMPMVLSPTIAGRQIELGLVFRPACIDRTKAEALLERVVELLDEYAR